MEEGREERVCREGERGCGGRERERGGKVKAACC